MLYERGDRHASRRSPPIATTAIGRPGAPTASGFTSSPTARSNRGQPPWGSRQPEPYFDRPIKIYRCRCGRDCARPSSRPTNCIPTRPDEPPEAAKPAPTSREEKADGEQAEAKRRSRSTSPALPRALRKCPCPPAITRTWQSRANGCAGSTRPRSRDKTRARQCLDIANKGDKPETLMEGVRGYEVPADGKKMLIRKQNDLFVVDAVSKAAALKDRQDARRQPGGSEGLDVLRDSDRRVPRGVPGRLAAASRLLLRPRTCTAWTGGRCATSTAAGRTACATAPS